jgi:hypothetical protein
VRLLEMRLEQAHVSDREQEFFEKIRAPAGGGSIDLFD